MCDVKASHAASRASSPFPTIAIFGADEYILHSPVPSPSAAASDSGRFVLPISISGREPYFSSTSDAFLTQSVSTPLSGATFFIAAETFPVSVATKSDALSPLTTVAGPRLPDTTITGGSPEGSGSIGGPVMVPSSGRLVSKQAQKSRSRAAISSAAALFINQSPIERR